ncbi:MAG: hypothetical protein HYY45_08715 [Deltaproteobacteria bacterium]|nr:hypothetical protein [Deltaproteobacteria bacterium]
MESVGHLEQAGVRINMDGPSRVMDNLFRERLWWDVKYEDIYVPDYVNGRVLGEGLRGHFRFYNTEGATSGSGRSQS